MIYSYDWYLYIFKINSIFTLQIYYVHLRIKVVLLYIIPIDLKNTLKKYQKCVHLRLIFSASCSSSYQEISLLFHWDYFTMFLLFVLLLPPPLFWQWYPSILLSLWLTKIRDNTLMTTNEFYILYTIIQYFFLYL